MNNSARATPFSVSSAPRTPRRLDLVDLINHRPRSKRVSKPRPRQALLHLRIGCAPVGSQPGLRRSKAIQQIQRVLASRPSFNCATVF